MVMLWAWLCCKITRQPFRSFAIGFYWLYSAACGWEHGTTASSAGLFVNTANEFPATILSVEVPELSHKNVVASEASNSRLVKEKARVCVTNFTCILLENQVHAAVRVSVSSKSFFKNSLSAVHFRCVFGSLGTFLAIWRVWWQISKKARVCH